MRYYPETYCHFGRNDEHIVKSESLRVLVIQVSNGNGSYVIVPGDIIAYKILGNLSSETPLISLVKPVEDEYKQNIKREIIEKGLEGQINFW